MQPINGAAQRSLWLRAIRVRHGSSSASVSFLARRAMARVCIIRQYHYPLDPRVRREAAALELLGHEVDVICLRGSCERPRERRGRITVYRLPLTHRRGGPLRYLFEYAAFMLGAALVATALQLLRHYRLIQVNTMPDATVEVRGADVYASRAPCQAPAAPQPGQKRIPWSAGT